MAPIHRFRSVWGVEPGTKYEAWAQWFPLLKEQGYAGVEIDIPGREDLETVRRICDQVGLEVIALIFSSWPGYLGPRPGQLSVQDHLKHYRSEMEAAKTLKAVKVNGHSGDDEWSVEQSVEFFKGTLAIDAEFGFAGRVSHETHRNRAFYSPYVTAKTLAQVPDLHVTADFSHWVVVSERLFDQSDADKTLLSQVIPHVDHIHARIGTTQSSQCPEPTNPAFNAERHFFETAWKQIIKAQSGRDSSRPITFDPEYGPFPYHPFGTIMTYSDLADNEGRRLQTLFEEFAK